MKTNTALNFALENGSYKSCRRVGYPRNIVKKSGISLSLKNSRIYLATVDNDLAGARTLDEYK